ncbi:MAG: hypothetical protein Q7U89_07765 [Coriobacteriia bacterium]|nr:hypothetical protein [Coriobacteriia bacterium]
MSLSAWLADGSVKSHAPQRKEILHLLAIADRDLSDANVAAVSVDRRFATAYSAALQLVTVVMRASGYRTASSAGGHHWKSIALLTEFMGPEQSDRKRYLDSCRRARNEADYDRVGVASKADLLELLQDTLEFRREVLDWLDAQHPELR